MDALLAGFADTLTLANLFYVSLGVFMGLAVGAIPGLSAGMAIALAVPLTYHMPMIAAIGFLVGINKGGYFGGSLSAILLNAPGAAEATVTACDGYPMAQRGQGLKAMKFALFASTFGDGFSTLLLILVAAPLATVALRMGPTEICAMIVFALSLISILESKSLAKGLVAASLGMLISTVGMDPAGGTPRLTLGLYQLERGIPIVVLGIGLLALSEVVLQSWSKKKPGSAAEATLTLSANRADNQLGPREFFSYLRTLLRSSAIGSAIGALPGIGASAAAFLAYGAARNSSKEPESFGSGNPEGIVAAESANNAVVGAALIPLFTLGIPGNIASALLIGAFVLHGVTPGPLMFEQNARLVYGVYGTMIISNILLLVIGYFGIKFFARILSFPRTVLFPVIMFTCLMGAYMSEQDVFSVMIMCSFTVLGVIMRRLRFSFVCLLIGFILGPMFELSFQQSWIAFSHNPWLVLQRPVTVVIALITLAFIALQARKRGRNA